MGKLMFDICLFFIRLYKLHKQSLKWHRHGKTNIGNDGKTNIHLLLNVACER